MSHTVTFLSIKVPSRVLRHFTHKASVTTVHAKANVYSADWLRSIFVNELAPPHVRGQQGQCVQPCRRIIEGTLVSLKYGIVVWSGTYSILFLYNLPCLTHELYLQHSVEDTSDLIQRNTVSKVLARDPSTLLYDGQITPWTDRIKKFNRCDILKNSCWESSIDLNLVHTEKTRP